MRGLWSLLMFETTAARRFEARPGMFFYYLDGIVHPVWTRRGRGSSREPREGRRQPVYPSSIQSRAVLSHPIEMTPMASTEENPRKIGATSYTLP